MNGTFTKNMLQMQIEKSGLPRGLPLHVPPVNFMTLKVDDIFTTNTLTAANICSKPKNGKTQPYIYKELASLPYKVCVRTFPKIRCG